jgi:hypothetical protein
VPTEGRRRPAAPSLLGATALLLVFVAWPLAWAPLGWLGPAGLPGQPAGSVSRWAVADASRSAVADLSSATVADVSSATVTDSHRSVRPLGHGRAHVGAARHALAQAASVLPGAPATVQLSRLAPVPLLRAYPPRARRVPAPPVRAPPPAS